MTKIQELQAKIKSVRAEARATIQTLTNELNEARESAKVERRTKAQVKASAKVDSQGHRGKGEAGGNHSQRVTIKGTSARALMAEGPINALNAINASL